MKHGKQLWVEDDATQWCDGHEGIRNAYRRLFGADYSKEPRLETENLGDEFWYRTRHAVVCHSYDGHYVYALSDDYPICICKNPAPKSTMLETITNMVILLAGMGAIAMVVFLCIKASLL